MTKADSGLIDWLLSESGVSRYYISEKTGISQSTLSRIAHGETQMQGVSFGVASRLTAFARELKRESTEYDEMDEMIDVPTGTDTEYKTDKDKG